MRYRFECPRCGNTHTALTGEITHAKYLSAHGVVETCSLKVEATRDNDILVTFFKMVESTPWKIRTNRVHAEAT